jgi:hypothetical protein
MQNQSPWQSKPWWCQPWSILLTGFGLILGSWLGLGRWWLTLLLALPLTLWMVYFLVIWPRLLSGATHLDSEPKPEPKPEPKSD